MRVMHLATRTCVGTALILSGCVVNEYDIEMQATGEGLERTLRVSKAESPEPQLTEAERNRIRDEYRQPELEKVESAYRYHGRFPRRLPNDIGGYGTHWRLVSPCGSATLYLERFRGNDDLVALQNQRQQAVQDAVNLLAGWLATETAGKPDSEQLLEFIRTTFRHDLQNISLYLLTADLWTTSGDFNHLHESQISERIALYLLERDYVTQDDLPVLLRALWTQDVAATLSFVNAVVVRKLKIDPASGEQLLGFLNDRDVALQRLENYLRTTPDFEKLQGARPEEERDRVQPVDVLSQYLMLAFLPAGFLKGHDVVTARLTPPVAPFVTNGTSFDDPPTIDWEFRIEPLSTAETGHAEPSRQLPQLAFAGWAQPDVDYQRARFGKTVLDGQDLAQFNLWYHGLSAPEQQEWETFLASRRPGRQLISNMKAFRFASERGPGRPVENEPLVNWPVKLIERKLNQP